MKTKPITLILTLLFCLSGSVFAEDKSKQSKNRGNYKLLDEINQSTSNVVKYRSELIEIWKEIDDKDILTKREIVDVIEWMDEAKHRMENLKTYLIYEKLFIDFKIDNRKFLLRHALLKDGEFGVSMTYFKTTKTFITKCKVKIQNVAAVVCINNYLEGINEFEKWLKLNQISDPKMFNIELYNGPELEIVPLKK